MIYITLDQKHTLCQILNYFSETISAQNFHIHHIFECLDLKYEKSMRIFENDTIITQSFLTYYLYKLIVVVFLKKRSIVSKH